VRLRLDATGRRIVVAHRDARAVLVLDAATRSVARRIPLDSQASALALDPRSDRIYVARRGGLMVEVFDPGSPFPTRGFPVDGDVGFLEVDPEGNTLCMVLPDRDEVLLVRLVGGQVVARLGIGPGPGEPAFSGSR
jgi:DNA-binding beta-propeller fold protein YncE